MCEDCGNGVRHHHYSLGKKVSELCERIGDLEMEVEFLKSLIPKDIRCKARHRFIKMIKQKAKVLEESKKFEVLEKDLALIGVFHSY